MHPRNIDPNPKRNYLVLTITIFAGFLMFGFSENVKGPAIPRIQDDFTLSVTEVGLLLAVNSLGYLLACFYTAGLARKIGLKATLILCLTGMALSGAGICFAPNYLILLLSYFVMYLGNGMLEITLGVMAATIFTKNTGTMMNLSHFFYGLSSAVAPLLSAGLMNARFGGQILGWRYMYLLVLSWCLLPVIPAILGRMKRSEETEESQTKGYKVFLRDKYAWLIIVILSLGVTCEMGVGGWLANFMERTYRLSETSAAIVLTAFFACFTLARLLLGPLTDKIGFVKSLIIFTAFGGGTVILGVLLGKIGIALLIASGFGLAPIYPTVMALMAKRYRENIESAMTVTLTIMGFIIVISNLMIGGIIDLSAKLLSSSFGEPATGLAYTIGYGFIGLCSLAALGATLALYRKLKKANELT